MRQSVVVRGPWEGPRTPPRWSPSGKARRASTHVVQGPWEGPRTPPRWSPSGKARRASTRSLFLSVALAAIAAVASSAHAQPMMAGGGGMPNLAEIVGRPLPDNGMSPGTVSVRVARQMPSNGVADAEVSAVIKNAGGDLRRRTEKTDSDGRALFEGMAPGDEFNAEVTVDGELLKTEAFTIPQVGGLRTMLIAALGKGGGNGAPTGAAAAPGAEAGTGAPGTPFTLG